MHTSQSVQAQRFQQWLGQRSESERMILAQLWGLSSEDSGDVGRMSTMMLRPETLQRLLERLPEAELRALQQVQRYGGQIAAAILERDFGRVRAHANYQNPRAYLLALEQLPDPTEALFLKGLLHEERRAAWHVYRIPDELFVALPYVPLRSTELALIPDPPPEAPAEIVAAEADRLERLMLEFLIAARRQRLPVLATGALTKEGLKQLDIAWNKNKGKEAPSRESYWPYAQFMRMLAISANLVRIDAGNLLCPTHEALAWMRLSAHQRSHHLLEAWVASAWDDMRVFAGLKFGNELRRHMPEEKRSLLQFVVQLPVDQWVSLDTLVEAIYRADPDFMRTDGEYGHWRITDRFGRSVDGFEHWHDVEGQFIRMVITGSLYWLGLLDLSVLNDVSHSVRLTRYGSAVLHNQLPEPAAYTARIIVQPNFEVVVPPETPPYDRFQLDRIAELVSGDETQLFRLTRRSIQDALEGGGEFKDIMAFLEASTAQRLPQNVLASLHEWAGSQRRLNLRRAAILSAESAALLEQVRHDRRIRLSGRALNEQEWELPESEAAILAERLRKSSYGVQNDAPDVDTPLNERDMTSILAALLFVSRHDPTHLVSSALLQRVMRLLPERQIQRAYELARIADNSR